MADMTGPTTGQTPSPPDAAPRMAKCTMCTRRVPSTTPHLAFFQDLSAGRTDHECRRCGYHLVAHVKWDDPAGHGWPRNVPAHPFEARVEGRDVDSFYCGCRGWD